MNPALMPFSTPEEFAENIISNSPQGYLYNRTASNYFKLIQGFFTQHFYFLQYAQSIIESLPTNAYTSPNDYNPLLNSNNPLLDKYVAAFGVAQFNIPLNTPEQKANAIALFFKIRFARTIEDLTAVFLALGYDVVITPGTGADIFTVFITTSIINPNPNASFYGVSTYGNSVYSPAPDLTFIKSLLTNLFPCYIYVVFN